MDRVDIVVIGGGIAGASVASKLAGHASVVLVETESQLGTHATGRSAAMTNRTSGPVAICELSEASRPFLETPPEGFSEVPLLSPRGLLWVGRAGTDALLDGTAAKAPTATTRVDHQMVHELVPLLFAPWSSAGGVYEPGAMTIDVAALLQGYRRALTSSGSIIWTDAEAIRIERLHPRPSGPWTVTAGHHVLECATIVNAAGAWGDVVAHRAGVHRLGLRPLRRTAVLIDAPPSTSDWPMVMDVEGRWYVTPQSGGLLISSADEEPSEPADVHHTEADVAQTVDRINDAFDLGIRSARRAWAGLRTFTHDRVPAVGPDPNEPSFVWLVGQGGAGIKTSPALSDLVANSILRGEPIPSELDISRLRH